MDSTNGAGPAGGRVFVVYNTARWMYRFRLPLMRALQDLGYEVCGVSPPDAYSDRLGVAGIRHIPIRVNRRGTNPLEDMLLGWRLYALFRRERPDLVLAYTIKPNIYCLLAARPLGIPVVNTIPGLGAVFVRRNLVTFIAKLLYRTALRDSRKVFFQNPDDLALFVQSGLVRGEIAERVPGSGVDTTFFSPGPRHRNGGPFVFLLAGRLLWDKGIGELVEAVRILRSRRVDVTCRLLGFFDPDNPGAIAPEQVVAWEREGLVDYLGEAEEVVEFMREADCVVLPSYYREGVPRTLLEAASVGKPIIAADAPGNRDIVEHGRNGYLCRPYDAADLAEKMQQMALLPAERRERMGREGRELVCRQFDERLVIRRYLEVIAETLENGRSKRDTARAVPARANRRRILVASGSGVSDR